MSITLLSVNVIVTSSLKVAVLWSFLFNGPSLTLLCTVASTHRSVAPLSSSFKSTSNGCFILKTIPVFS